MALFLVELDESLSENITLNLDYCNRLYIQSSDLFCINWMSYNVSLLCGIKLYQLLAESITVENIVTGQTNERENINETINVLKMQSYCDYNSTPGFLLHSNLVSNFLFNCISNLKKKPTKAEILWQRRISSKE
ncbi:MAG: hypothetical protein Ta2E_12300 [Mycoplasmoidaceae bacterium]|nr:MAG: hypothetical protein Ta2E_12300 [Mycoplasmoidaceae bacterium]